MSVFKYICYLCVVLLNLNIYSVQAAVYNIHEQLAVDLDDNGKGVLTVQMLPTGIIQTFTLNHVFPEFDQDEKYHITFNDVNFDGYKDLIISQTIGNLNKISVVFIFNTAEKQFVLLQPVKSSVYQQCRLFASLETDVHRQLLFNNCQDTLTWYSDIYKFSKGNLYLYQVVKPLFINVANTDINGILDLSLASPADVFLYELLTFNQAGKVESRTMDMATDITVKTDQISLQPSSESRSKKNFNLKQNDRLQIMGVKDCWWRVEFAKPGIRPVLGWLPVCSVENRIDINKISD